MEQHDKVRQRRGQITGMDADEDLWNRERREQRPEVPVPKLFVLRVLIVQTFLGNYLGGDSAPRPGAQLIAPRTPRRGVPTGIATPDASARRPYRNRHAGRLGEAPYRNRHAGRLGEASLPE